MFAKRILSKAIHNHLQRDAKRADSAADDVDLRVCMHYGVPSTASILAFDPIQHLLSIGTQDGRIKVIGGDGIEGLFLLPEQVPVKFLEFLRNQGFLVSVTIDNSIQVWNLENRGLASCHHCESNITAFSVINSSNFIYLGDEHGSLSVFEFDADTGKLLQLPYHVSATYISEVAGVSRADFNDPVVGILHQPCVEGYRVLIAYENGLIVLFDIAESQVLFIGGANDLLLKSSNVDSTSQLESNLMQDASEHCLGEKEISALCWASCDGSILAVGYVDGDILFWNTSRSSPTKHEQPNLPSNNVVRLRVSSAERRLPVIVLQWSSIKKCQQNNGMLFIYGGDQIRAEEVLTILNLEWSSKMDGLRCVGRVDIALDSSFSDVVLLPNVRAWNNHNASLFLLTNHGKLQFLDSSLFFNSMSHQERVKIISAVEFPTVFTLLNPSVTVSKLSKLLTAGCSSKLAEYATSYPTHRSEKFPLTGGVLMQSNENGFQAVYMVGYDDGSVSLSGATHISLSPICYLQCKMQGIPVSISSSPVSSLNFCSHTLSLAVGHENGLVLFYVLEKSRETSNFHFITKSGSEVYPLPTKEISPCRAIFSLFSSPVQVLEFSNQATKLAVGYLCGEVAVLDVSALSVLFCLDCSSNSLSPVVATVWKSTLKLQHDQINENPNAKSVDDPVDEFVFVLTKDSKIHVIDGKTCEKINSNPQQLKQKSIPISMYLIEDSDSTSLDPSNEEVFSKEDHLPQHDGVQEQMHARSNEDDCTRDRLLNSLIYLCYDDSVRVYKTKSIMEGKGKHKHKNKLSNSCIWASIFEKDGLVCGLVLVYRTGDMEIRSLSDFALVKKCSLNSFLPCNFEANIKQTISCDGKKIALANGSELAFISLAAGGVARMAEALPSLHDHVVAAAADAVIGLSSSQKKKQGSTSSVVKGIVKGFKSRKPVERTCPTLLKPDNTQLREFFSKSPSADRFHEGVKNVKNTDQLSTSDQEVDLNIDDIEIDDFTPAPTSTAGDGTGHAGKPTDREKLFHGASDDVTPRVRTPAEIMAHYRKWDPSTAAEHARNKLAERQEKLERIRQRTEDLRNGAEDFASLADELVKTLERRKWWQI
ncbi:hypothetical protein MLD38_029967 [Melastoma candidum]|uniref:Uncharacterized protein n=1 Tax=Melastoma candidum TaxID=119954 RepID=A0ACB9MKW0_9MYRT|nr:hypothetical protein MLD38_029967 [Melastoma candidum]